ncbi:MAG: hypothetical protein WCX71_03155 [Candidatus Buchananbacteria bacterium]
MKKIYLISAVTIIIGIIFYLNAVQLKFLWGAQLLLLPIISGILMVLVQREDRSYRFLPKLIFGSLITAFVFACVIQVIECFDYNYGSHCPIPNLASITPFVLFLSGIFIFGGLIGIALKGAYLLLNKNNGYGKA